MTTSRMTINEAEVAAILPGLEAVVNVIASARLGHFPRVDPRVQFSVSNGSSVYSQAESDETMAGHMLTARNKLKWLNPSRKIRLNSFELAAAAFALRLVQREALVPEDMLAKVPTLGNKLEKYRRRAKRAAIKEIGNDTYGEQAKCWRRFLQWMRCIHCFRPAPWRSSGPRLLHRDQREKLLALAIEVVPTAAPAHLRHLVDLAKREVLRDRHPTTLGLLMSDDTRAREFLAQFIVERDGPDILAPEFQSLDVRQSARGEQLKLALIIDDGEEEGLSQEIQAQKKARDVHRNTTKGSVPTANASAEVQTGTLAPADSQIVPTQQELAEHYAHWLLEEADPADWEAISTQVHYLAKYFNSSYVWKSASKTVAEAIANAKAADVESTVSEPRSSDVPLTTFDIINFYAEWGARWLLSVNPARTPVRTATVEGIRLAREQWAHLDISTRQCKLDAIYRRYFQ
jgi:hypothetical protein